MNTDTERPVGGWDIWQLRRMMYHRPDPIFDTGSNARHRRKAKKIRNQKRNKRNN